MQLTNEQIAWNYLIQRFTKEQAAGIMGNLRQEHNFKTDDVPSGLGIAQWLGARREQLIQRGNYSDINVQLDYIVWELENTESRASTQLRAQTTVEGATRAFQNYYERCGDCRESQRIQYAIEYYNRY